MTTSFHHDRSLTPVDHDAAPATQKKLPTAPQDQAIELNASGTTLQYGNITPAASPVLGHMPPPPVPQQALEAHEARKRRTSNELNREPTKIVCLRTTPVKQRGISLAASHPLLYDTRTKATLPSSTPAVAETPAQCPTHVSPRPAPRVDFPHGIVDPAISTHCTANGPPRWQKPYAISKSDYDRTSLFVVSPTGMIGLPFGGTVEFACAYPADPITIEE